MNVRLLGLALGLGLALPVVAQAQMLQPGLWEMTSSNVKVDDQPMDVQSILGASSQHVGSAIGGGLAGAERYAWGWNAANTWNGGGQHFSNDYGYGLVDAHAAVRMAESWLLTGESAQRTTNEFTNTMDVLNSATVIPDGNATGLSFSGNAAFDEYRSETLRRLEDEQKEFVDYLERLRQA